MTDSGLFLPLRFYDNYEDTVLGRKECKDFNHVEYFCFANNYIPPFQYTGSQTSTFDLIGCGEENTINLSTHYDLVEDEDTGKSTPYVTFLGGNITPVPSGVYYLKGGGKVSDPFYLMDTSGLPMIKFKGRAVLGDVARFGIYFKDNFEPRMWINADVQKPEYPIINETREDEEGTEHQVFQRWEKRRKIQFKGVESMADAVSILPLMDEVYLGSTRIYDIVPTIMWEDEYDCLADIELSFRTRKLLKSF